MGSSLLSLNRGADDDSALLVDSGWNFPPISSGVERFGGIGKIWRNLSLSPDVYYI
jgi:hypothetical protein